MPLLSCAKLTESPGSTVGACTKEESFASIAKAINQAHKEVPEVITVIENMVNHLKRLSDGKS
jgi:endonuclease IV